MKTGDKKNTIEIRGNAPFFKRKIIKKRALKQGDMIRCKMTYEPGDIIEFVDRDEFAQEMVEEFKGNIELLKAIEECMNRNVKPNQRVTLTT